MDAPVNCGIRIQKEIIDDIQTGTSETVTQHTTQLQEVHKIKALKCKPLWTMVLTALVKLVSLVSGETGERCKISEPSKSVEPNEIGKLVSSVATEYR